MVSITAVLSIAAGNVWRIITEESNEEEAGSPAPKDLEKAEFSDDEQIATVTITEDFDPSASIYPIRTSTSPSPSVDDKSELKSKKPTVKLLPPSSRRAQKADEKKKEKKKISRSMETKAERRKGKEMELRKRSKKAALAMERKGKTPRGPKKGMGKGRHWWFESMCIQGFVCFSCTVWLNSKLPSLRHFNLLSKHPSSSVAIIMGLRSIWLLPFSRQEPIDIFSEFDPRIYQSLGSAAWCTGQIAHQIM